MKANTINSEKKPTFSRDLLLDIFYPKLVHDESLAIAKHLQTLISKPHSTIEEEFTAELNKINCYTVDLINHSKNLKESEHNVSVVDVYQRLKKQKLLIEHHATAFVCCSLTSRTYRQDKFDHYKLLVLVAGVRLAEIGTNDSPIHSVFREIRQLGLGYREDLAKFLPDANEYDIASLIDYIDDTRNKESTSSNIKRCLSGYYIALDHAYYAKEGRTRKGSNTERNKMMLVQSEQTEESEYKDATVIQIRERFKPKTKTVEQWQREEEDATVDDHPAYSVVSLNQQTARDIREQQLKGKRIIDWISRKKQRVPCDYQSLTQHELTTLATQIFTDITSTAGSTALCYLLSLLTGKHVSNIKQQIAAKSKQIRFKKHFTALTVQHQVDAYRQENEVKHLLRHVEKSVTLFLPPIPTWNINTNSWNDTTAQDTWLKQINKQNNTRLTSQRIANQIYVFQRQHQLDEVLCHITSGQETQKVSGTPYTHASSEQLQCFLNQYFHWLAEITGIPSLSPNTINHSTETTHISKALGSPLYLKDQHIIDTNQRHINHLEELKKKGLRFIFEFHNEYVLYIYRLITLSSGYRPVVGTGGKLSDICLTSGRYWISDKERRQGIAARMLVLPTITVEQIKHYQSHLQALSILTSNQMPAITTHIRHILDGQRDFLFLLAKNQITTVTPKNLESMLTKQFPVAPNWHRHFLRSYLAEKNVNPSMIDSFMGHEEIAQEGLGRFSNFSYQSFKQLSEVINSLLIQLHFTRVSGCQIR